MTLAVAGKVNAGASTVSPGLMPSVHSAKCSAAVPEDTTTACGRPENFSNARSNAATFSPCTSMPERNTATARAMSSSRKSGFDSRIMAPYIVCR